MADHVDVDDFPSWFFAEVDGVGDDPWQVLLVHVETPGGLTVYWGDDPERPRRVFPLMDSMNPSFWATTAPFSRKKGICLCSWRCQKSSRICLNLCWSFR